MQQQSDVGPVRSAPMVNREVSDEERARITRTAPARLSPYARGGNTGAEVAGLAVWIALWVLNGALTVMLAQTLGLAWWIGAIGHVIISLIEQHGWRSGRWSMRVLMVGFIFVDIFSSAWGIQGFFTSRGAPSGEISTIAAMVYTILAMAIAIAPEPFLVGHVVALLRILRR